MRFSAPLYVGGTLDTWSVNQVYDTWLRRTALQVKKSSALQIEHDYSYDNASRMKKVWQGSYQNAICFVP